MLCCCYKPDKHLPERFDGMIIQELHSKSREIETVVRDLDKMVNTSCPNCIMRQKLNELKKLAYDNCELAQEALMKLGR